MPSLAWASLRGVVCDMDGVLWRGDEPLPHLVAWFSFLRQRGLAFCLATNNATKSAHDYIEKLARMGVTDITARHIVTSASATADYLRQRFVPHSPIHVLGGAGVKQAIQQAGLRLADPDEMPVAVVVGLDRELSYDKARRAAHWIRQGAPFIGTNPDTTFPMPDGLAPGAGSLIAMIQAASGQTPLIIGKPAPTLYQMALAQMEIPAEAALMVGDRLDTDIDGARALGMATALVLTGVSRAEDVPPARVDGVFADLGALMQVWQA